ncbi:MAG: DUF2325 domain-containing protein [Myxococcota bacterium]|nr:DUF2325 domain-containing protein [Myxococcota bacterium]
MSARTRVAFVGGIDRLERQIVAFGEEMGIDVEVHTGRTSGASTSQLSALVRRSDLVVVVTGTNSHNAVNVIKREAARRNVTVRLVTFCGASSARALLAGVHA